MRREKGHDASDTGAARDHHPVAQGRAQRLGALASAARGHEDLTAAQTLDIDCLAALPRYEPRKVQRLAEITDCERRYIMATDNGVVYFSAAQLARRYSVHVVTVWRWAQTGRLPRPIRLTPRTTRWRKDQIEASEAERARNQE